mmetsp:Transcript_45851/g.106577  ORF Transcript_45851/g.106577 Transcript_45851/m.106577 type:complete len:260 (-) Transcript_45851:453-1232(-)
MLASKSWDVNKVSNKVKPFSYLFTNTSTTVSNARPCHKNMPTALCMAGISAEACPKTTKPSCFSKKCSNAPPWLACIIFTKQSVRVSQTCLQSLLMVLSSLASQSAVARCNKASNALNMPASCKPGHALVRKTRGFKSLPKWDLHLIRASRSCLAATCAGVTVVTCNDSAKANSTKDCMATWLHKRNSSGKGSDLRPAPEVVVGDHVRTCKVRVGRVTSSCRREPRIFSQSAMDGGLQRNRGTTTVAGLISRNSQSILS